MLKKILVCAFIILAGNIVPTEGKIAPQGGYAKWQNWAKNQYCNTATLAPSTAQELVDIVKKAAQEGKTIRAYGTGHSWSDIVCNDGYIINTEKLNSIISVDKATNQVTVQAGIKIKDLNEQLSAHGLALSNLGVITDQSLAGVISTATHGSGKTGTMASFITQVKLLTADGNIKTISATQNNEFFPAVRTSIGSLGIMTELTVQCEPLFQLKRETKTMNWHQFVREYENLLQTNNYMQATWDATDNSMEVLIHNRIPAQKAASELATDDSFRMLAGKESTIYIEEEIAVPRTRFVEAAQEVQRLIQKHDKNGGLFPGILFRFVQAEKNNLLSPAADRDVVFVSVTTRSMTGYEPFFKEFYAAMLKYNGRPHWGKINYLTQKDTKKLYGDNYTQFVAIRKKLDPQGTFSNKYIKKIFGW